MDKKGHYLCSSTVARNGIGGFWFITGIGHSYTYALDKVEGYDRVPRRALNAGSMFPLEAIKTASMTFSSTFGKASFRVTLFCSIGLTGRGGFGGAAVVVLAGMTGGAAVDGVGSKLLSSGRVDSCLSDMMMEEFWRKTEETETKSQGTDVEGSLNFKVRLLRSGNTLREDRVRGLGELGELGWWTPCCCRSDLNEVQLQFISYHRCRSLVGIFQVSF
jgi:hypothetical protein